MHPTTRPAPGPRKRRFWRPASAVLLATVGGGGILAAAILIPNLIESRKNGNEVAAIGALGTIGAAQSLFREGDLEGDGNLDYGTLAELGAAGLIDSVLATGTRYGYVFEASYGPLTSEFIWMATARPVEPGRTGDRYFGINHQGNPFYTTTQSFPLTADCVVPPGAGVT